MNFAKFLGTRFYRTLPIAASANKISKWVNNFPRLVLGPKIFCVPQKI